MSLIGIIFVQAYYIKDSVKNERERFSFNVKKTLSYVSNAIEENELDTYFEKYQKLINDKKVDSVAVSQLFIYQQNSNTKETLIYKSGVLEENYKLSSSLFDIGLDSINIKNIIGSSNLEVYKNEDISEKDLSKSPIVNIINSGRLLPAERNYFEKNYGNDINVIIYPGISYGFIELKSIETAKKIIENQNNFQMGENFQDFESIKEKEINEIKNENLKKFVQKKKEENTKEIKENSIKNDRSKKGNPHSSTKMKIFYHDLLFDNGERTIFTIFSKISSEEVKQKELCNVPNANLNTEISGLILINDFITEEEELNLLNEIDNLGNNNEILCGNVNDYEIEIDSKIKNLQKINEEYEKLFKDYTELENERKIIKGERDILNREIRQLKDHYEDEISGKNIEINRFTAEINFLKNEVYDLKEKNCEGNE